MTASRNEAPPARSAIDGVRATLVRIVTAWARHDARAFADVFAENGTMILPGNVFAEGRAAIAEFMTTAFAGPYRGTQVTWKPVHLRFPRPDLAVPTTRGGVLAPGETSIAPERAVIATWTAICSDGEWWLVACQNTPSGPA